MGMGAEGPAIVIWRVDLGAVVIEKQERIEVVDGLCGQCPISYQIVDRGIDCLVLLFNGTHE